MTKKTYLCDVSYVTYGTAYIQAESLEEAKKLFEQGDYHDIIGEDEDMTEFNLESVREAD